MKRATILLADNTRAFLRRWSKVLRDEDYEVVEAGSYEKAKNLLEKGVFDIAVLDLRLTDDHDDQDVSGLELAEKFTDRLSIIIFTGMPSVEAATRALEREGRRAPAVAFVDKAKGAGALLKAVRKAFVPKVFVAHGHDLPARDSVVKFLEEIGAKPVVLQEEAGATQTIIEKFMEHSNVHFAIVLVTPDDLGKRDDAVSDYRPRARQNVIFELGYFLGKVGRGRVVALKAKEVNKGAIEMPSNLDGVGYIDLDPGGGWRVELAKEMRKAGIDVQL